MENTEKKYRLVKVNNSLYQIEALRSFGLVAKGTRGGYVSSSKNLSQEGDCWIQDGAYVTDHSRVRDNALIGEGTMMRDYAVAEGDSRVGGCVMEGHSVVGGNANISDSWVSDYVKVSGDAYITDGVKLKDYVEVYGDAFISGDVTLYNNITVRGSGHVSGIGIRVSGDAVIESREDILIMPCVLYDYEPFAYTRSNNKWSCGDLLCDDGEMRAKMYDHDKLMGKYFDAMIEYRDKVFEIIENK